METQSKNISLKVILIIIGAGIWVMVLQNVGIIPASQRVQVTNEVDVSGSVRVSGSVDVDNTVRVEGSVDVGEVDVNISKVNGWKAANFYKYTIDGKEYHSLGTN